MSKKELVKNVIEDLLDQGKDFHEITQGTLSHVKELENISKTTIKRAKNEYKKEKIVVKSDYKETLIKRKIYKYLDRHPKTTLSDLREALPEIPPNKISEYHLFWTRKREKAKADRAQRRMMISPRKLKEMVFNYLNTNENASCEDLYKAFPEANRSSITSYFGHWKKKRANQEKGKEGSLYNVVFNFLDKHPDSTIDTLQGSFADVPRKSLEVYLNLWLKKRDEDKEKEQKQSRRKSGKTPQKARKQSVSRGEAEERPNKKRDMVHAAAEDLTGFVPLSREVGRQIEQLRSQIEEQKLTLTALEVENTILKENLQSQLIDGIDDMTQNEIKELKDFIKTYVKGLEEPR